MVKFALTFLFLSFALVACGQVTPPPTVSPTATARPTLTVMVTPTVTASATFTPTPSATPFPMLSGEKPYLVVRSNSGDGLLVYDRSGQGRQIFSLPEKIGYYSAFSPDGKWFAFYTGEFGRGDGERDLPVTLNILNTKDGTIHKVADVVTDVSAKKLPELVAKLKALDPDYYKPIDDWDWAESAIIGAFAERLFSFVWSPDSDALAFAGQMEGLSSDVYLYDVGTGAVQKLNDDLESVWSIFWSPDGKKILFQNAYPGNTYVSSTLHIVESGAKTAKDPESVFSSWFFAGGSWLSPNLLLVGQGSDTGGNSRLQTLNVNTKQLSTYLWEDVYTTAVVDPESQNILLNTHELAEPEIHGLYLLTSNGSRRKVFDGLYWLNKIIFRGSAKHRFLISGYSLETAQYQLDGNIVGITADNKPTFFGEFDSMHIHISPDYAWMLIYDEEHLYLYDKNDELVKTFAIPGIDQILWRPDSQSIAYMLDRKLYFLSLSDGEPKFVDDCGGECLLDLDKAVWLP